jgi:hypothetical protein
MLSSSPSPSAFRLGLLSLILLFPRINSPHLANRLLFLSLPDPPHASFFRDFCALSRLSLSKDSRRAHAIIRLFQPFLVK